MAVNQSRSRVEDLALGATDGKYRKRRPDTELDPMNAEGDEAIRKNRSSVNPNFNYGFINQEAQDKVNPGK